MLKNLKIIYLFLILTITFIAFTPSLTHDFTNWDDGIYLINNPLVHSLDIQNIKTIFTNTVSGLYIPLTTLTFALEYHFFQLDPFVYHLNNVLLHLIVTALMFVLILRLGLPLRAAGLAALLFGIHPMHVESVAWVTERKDVLYAIFYLLALCSYWRYLENMKARQRLTTTATYVLTILFGLLSILAKPMALSLPLIFWILDWKFKRPLKKDIFLDKLPHILYIIPITWMTYVNFMRIPGKNFMEGLLLWTWSFMFHIIKFLTPFNIIPIYEIPQPISIFTPSYGLSLFLFIALCLCLIKYKKNTWFCFAFLFYFASIFFLLRYDASMDKHMVADRFMYLPSVGICMLLGYAGDKIFYRFQNKNTLAKLVLYSCVIMLFTTLSIKTFRQNKIWKDSLTLWNYVIAKSPNTAFAYHNRGVAHLDQSMYPSALDDFSQAIRLDPQYPDAYYNRGIIHKIQQRYDLAISDFDKAITINPYAAEYYNNRGAVLKITQHHTLAMKNFNRALKINPKLEEGYINRGALHVIQKNYRAAIADFNQAIQINPNSSANYLKHSVKILDARYLQ